MPTTAPSLARALFDAGDFDGTLKAADLEDDPFYAGVLKSCAYTEKRQWDESLNVLREVEHLYESAIPEYKSSFHHQRALSRDAKGEIDAARIEYEGARDWAVRAGNKIKEARAKNNIARLLNDAGRFDEAIAESNGAITIAETEHELAFLGRFLDQKAQILYKSERLREAVSLAGKAVELLEKHGNESTLREAQTTYGKALVKLGSGYLDQNTLEGYHARREVGLIAKLEIHLLQAALDQANGRVYQAAQLLGISHPSMITLIRSHKLERQPKRRRAKSIASLKK